jgi:hypothetical protein
VLTLVRAAAGTSLVDRTSAEGTSDCPHAAHTSIASPRASDTIRVMTGAFIML